MGYYMSQMESDFRIEPENVAPALDALKNLFRGGFKAGWVDEKEVIDADTFEDAMDAARWTVDMAADGGCDIIEFNGEKYSGDEERIFSAIAPFVNDGSYIQMRGEEGEMWRWKFEYGRVYEVSPQITW